MTIVWFLETSLVMLFVQHDEKQRRFFFLQDTDIVPSNLWTGNFVNFWPLQKGTNISTITIFQSGSKEIAINYGFTQNPDFGEITGIEGFINIYKGSLAGTKVATLDEIFPIWPWTYNYSDQVYESVPSTGNYYAQLQGNVITTTGSETIGSPTASTTVYY